MIKPKDRKHLDFSNYFKEVMKDPEYRKEYERLQPEFAPIEAILNARMKRGLSQKGLADKMGTKQSAIARLESGRANPTVAFLQKLSDALGYKLVIQFK